MGDLPAVAKLLRIVLISPKGPLYRHRGGIFGRGLRYKPLTLPTLASLIPAEIPHTLTCYDEGIGDVPDFLEADIVGLTVLTGSATRAYELADRYRAQGIIVVLGGPHPTLIPDDAQPHADSVVVGYAEDTWPQLVRDLVAGTLQKRYVQGPGLSLAGRPLPKRDVLPRRRYLTEHVVEATRGCVHRCDFCVVPAAWPGKPLQKPPEDIVRDLVAMKARRAIFVDLNLIADRAYALRLFAALEPLRIQWFGLATTLLADDDELLEACARSGCRGLLMGLESISDAGLKGMRKGFNDPATFARLVERLHAKRIALQGCFVFGGDEDRPGIFMETARFAVEAGIDLPRFAVLTPFPGTALHRRLESEGRILDRCWERYDGQHVVFQPKHLTVDELQYGIEQAWRYCYSWSGIAKRMRKTAAPWYIAAITNLTYRHYARNLHRFYTCDVMSWDAPRGMAVTRLAPSASPTA